ncbi:hypothetical protein [Lentzea flaviverrucosa]|uniref:Uncharacterized protein n=1 Tax=Lentzea flaviverrucosa TaxID=200379 RepID=A0A1H9XA17_9PSEU|nr:hypothetical protein [Lentzea flaviverrucosa]RDI21709.1 hypothetical protein DFR72_113256 [Lentzea flaviverrucosa]SES42972.1 hypothetical protein SAMN05216195_11424 [Lentzea flaviverrucosa]
MAGRPNAIPPVKCAAHGRKTKRPCGKHAVPGAVVCELHGGKAQQVAERALDRLTLAEIIRGDPRPLHVALADALHTVDAAFVDTKLRVTASGDELTADELDRLLASAERVVRHASVAIKTGAIEKIAESYERNTKLEGQLAAEVIGRVLDAFARGVGLDLEPVHRVRFQQELREWALESATLALSTVDSKGSGDDVTVPPPPLAGVAFVTVEPASSPTAQTSSTSANASDGERQRTGATSPSTSRSSASADVPAATVADESNEPLDAELVDEPLDAELVEPSTPPAASPPQPRTGWRPSGLPNPWRYGSPYTRSIG